MKKLRMMNAAARLARELPMLQRWLVLTFFVEIVGICEVSMCMQN